MTYTPDEIRTMRAEAEHLGLWDRESLDDADHAAQVCNGIGADWMPAVMRSLADVLNPAMKIPAAIHDVAYAAGGDDSDRRAADLIFHTNTLVVIDDLYAWYDPRRYIMRRRAGRDYDYLRVFGGKAFAYGGRHDDL